ncbi:hypothetical protein F4808DRAFT_415035 [Astrocystis sublimbata]|nr:hypothetical protein F4808DRAFT_415035 [Astrocystis sublimbata]
MASSSQPGYKYADPYVYQYSDVRHDDVSSEKEVATGSGPHERKGRMSTDMKHHELAANPLVEGLQVSSQPTTTESSADTPPTIPRRFSSLNIHPLQPSSSSEHDRSYPSVSYRDNIQSSQANTPANTVVHPDTGLIPVHKETHASTGSQASNKASSHQQSQPGQPAYSTGLMLADETSPSAGTDFDTILRNIGPLPKKDTSKISRERSSRYCDRYGSNAG